MSLRKCPLGSLNKALKMLLWCNIGAQGFLAFEETESMSARRSLQNRYGGGRSQVTRTALLLAAFVGSPKLILYVPASVVLKATLNVRNLWKTSL